MNAYFAASRMSQDEKNDILAKHRTLYDGYRTMQSSVSNEQPLYVQDFAKDKVGAVVNNKGVVKPYTNMGINEQVQKEVCDECGAMQMSEGECMECGWKGEVGAMEEAKELMCSECGGGMNEGECSECGYMKEETFEELFGGQKKLDVAEPKGKLTSADFKKLRSKKSEENESWGAVARVAVPMAASYIGGEMSDANEEDLSGEFDYIEADEGETEEGNAFTGALAKAKKDGDNTFTVDGKKYHVKESIQLTEEELIDVIEMLVKEETEKQKDNIKKGFKTRGMSEYEKSVSKSKSDTDDYIKSVTKKMKDYLKDASKGEYETNPKIYPAGNGQLKKMDKKAYIPSDAVQEYTDNFTAAGQENLVYDEIHPNEEWVSDNIEGSSRTGNNPKWANAVETPTNKKRNQIRKDNLLGQVKSQAYNKAPQPIVKDEAGESNKGGHMNLNLNKKANKILNQLESVNNKEEKLIKEEFDKINRLMNYNQKTQ